jgi:hypothetical protein
LVNERSAVCCYQSGKGLAFSSFQCQSVQHRHTKSVLQCRTRCSTASHRLQVQLGRTSETRIDTEKPHLIFYIPT